MRKLIGYEEARHLALICAAKSDQNFILGDDVRRMMTASRAIEIWVSQLRPAGQYVTLQLLCSKYQQLYVEPNEISVALTLRLSSESSP